MSVIPGQYSIGSVAYSNQDIDIGLNHVNGSFVILFRNRRLDVPILQQLAGKQRQLQSSAYASIVDRYATLLNQPIIVQWVLADSQKDGFIVINVRTGQFLTANGENVIVLSGQLSRWNIIHEGGDRYKFV